MMKLIIQMPCFNESKTLPVVVAGLPKKIAGIDKIETLVIDDGSTDDTSRVAKEIGVQQVIRLSKNTGLANAFKVGLQESLMRGADVIVNTDGDNQYNGSDIEKLITPILEHRAEIVVGERDIKNIEEFSYIKKKLQRLGSWFVRQISGTKITDATSGFRAYTRHAALHLNVTSTYTHTLETIIQAGKKKIALAFVPITRNKVERKSRLVKSNYSYVKKSIATMLRIYAMYEPLKAFGLLGGFIFLLGMLISIYYILLHIFNHVIDNVQILIVASILMILGFQIFVIGLAADLIAKNRGLLEDILSLLKMNEINKKSPKI